MRGVEQIAPTLRHSSPLLVSTIDPARAAGPAPAGRRSVVILTPTAHVGNAIAHYTLLEQLLRAHTTWMLRSLLA